MAMALAMAMEMGKQHNLWYEAEKRMKREIERLKREREQIKQVVWNYLHKGEDMFDELWDDYLGGEKDDGR